MMSKRYRLDGGMSISLFDREGSYVTDGLLLVCRDVSENISADAVGAYRGQHYYRG